MKLFRCNIYCTFVVVIVDMIHGYSPTVHKDIDHSPINRRKVITTTATSFLGSSLPLVVPSRVVSATTTSNVVTPVVDTTVANDQIKDYVHLNNGLSLKFPLVSFGLQIYDDETAYKLTLTALEVGYRNFFASVLAGNQRGFAKAIKDSQIPRQDLFICGSVVSNRGQGYDNAKRMTTTGWEKNLEAFSVGNIDYLDQIMLDYPGPDTESIRGQWSSFIEMMEQKHTKSLSVSNFSTKQLQSIVNVNDPTFRQYNPVVNQLPYSVAYHPGNPISDNAKFGVLVQAWAPLGGSLGGRFNQKMKDACTQIGLPYNKSGSQVALRWIIQNGGAICTQTKKRDHFIEDKNIFDFELSSDEMMVLGSLA